MTALNADVVTSAKREHLTCAADLVHQRHLVDDAEPARRDGRREEVPRHQRDIGEDRRRDALRVDRRRLPDESVNTSIRMIGGDDGPGHTEAGLLVLGPDLAFGERTDERTRLPDVAKDVHDPVRPAKAQLLRWLGGDDRVGCHGVLSFPFRPAGARRLGWCVAPSGVSGCPLSVGVLHSGRSWWLRGTAPGTGRTPRGGRRCWRACSPTGSAGWGIRSSGMRASDATQRRRASSPAAAWRRGRGSPGRAARCRTRSGRPAWPRP